MPKGELGQLYILGEKYARKPFADIDEFLTHFEENSEDEERSGSQIDNSCISD